jgi:hypothetical protein
MHQNVTLRIELNKIGAYNASSQTSLRAPAVQRFILSFVHGIIIFIGKMCTLRKVTL